MNKFEKFDFTVNKIREKNDFLSDNPFSEDIATHEEIINVEKILKLKFPKEYRYFLENYPAGNFRFSEIYSVKSDSGINIITINKEYLHGGYLLFSENGCGDFYGFKIENRECLSEIYFYDHEIEEWKKTELKDFFEFLYNDAFKI